VLEKLGPPRIDVHEPAFVEAALANVVDEAFLRAIAHVESNYKARARSRKGAKGIMQLMPATARQFRVRNPYSAEQSIAGGAKYLGRLMRRYNGDRRLVAAAYNAGPGNVRRYDGIPPFEETREYVQKVEVMYAQYRAALANDRTTRG
jgi:soluble lytic murein transglycosylase-like protein